LPTHVCVCVDLIREWIRKKQNEQVWTGFNGLGVGTSGDRACKYDEILRFPLNSRNVQAE
jgi:hypothetical protein